MKISDLPVRMQNKIENWPELKPIIERDDYEGLKAIQQDLHNEENFCRTLLPLLRARYDGPKKHIASQDDGLIMIPKLGSVMATRIDGVMRMIRSDKSDRPTTIRDIIEFPFDLNDIRIYSPADGTYRAAFSERVCKRLIDGMKEYGFDYYNLREVARLGRLGRNVYVADLGLPSRYTTAIVSELDSYYVTIGQVVTTAKDLLDIKGISEDGRKVVVTSIQTKAGIDYDKQRQIHGY